MTVRSIFALLAKYRDAAVAAVVDERPASLPPESEA